MVAVASAFLSESMGGERITISQEGLRSLLSQIEAELHHSDAYQQALKSLQLSLGESSDAAQLLLKGVGRSAIRLALRQFVTHFSGMLAPGTPAKLSGHNPLTVVPPLEPVAPPSPPSVPISSKVSPPVSKATATAPTVVPAAAHAHSQATSTTAPPVAPPPKTVQPRRATPPLSPKDQKRIELLQQIGTELRRSRQEQGLSLEQLHAQTWVPVHLIKALEDGDLHRLPEDIYVQGFVRRLGDALGLNGTEMSKPLMDMQATKTIIPSWQNKTPEHPTLRPVHLYLSYAALMAGALGGLAWISHQSPSPEATMPPVPDGASQPISQTNSSRAANSTSTAQHQGAIASPETTPPETAQF